MRQIAVYKKMFWPHHAKMCLKAYAESKDPDVTLRNVQDDVTSHILRMFEGIFFFHYENTPIQIYRQFLLQKLKIFR